MVGFGSSAGNASHRWDAKCSVAGNAAPRRRGAPVWRPGGAFADPNAREGAAPSRANN